MKERVIGIENEIAVVNPDKGSKATNDSIGKVLFEHPHRFGMVTGGAPKRLWCANGGCLYPDVNKAEWASPECRRVHDVVLYNKVGERLVREAFDHPAVEGHHGLYKFTIGPSSDSYGSPVVSMGCHESYLVYGMQPVSKGSAPYRPLLPFLITRQIYGGAGTWRMGRFARSQRAFFLSRDFSSVTTLGNRGIINERDEPLTKVENLTRLHLIMGDANMLEYALYLKIGATKLMLDLMEERRLPHISVRCFAVPERDGTASAEALAMQEVAVAEDLNDPMLEICEDGKEWFRVSPIQLQERYCELLTSYANKTSYASAEAEEETRRVCRMLEETLSALKCRDDKHLFGRVDWYTKERLAQNDIARLQKRGMAVDLKKIRDQYESLYHELGGQMQARLVQSGKAARILTEAQIERGMMHPPEPLSHTVTRATVRGEAIADVMAERPRRTTISSCSWQEITLMLELEPELPNEVGSDFGTSYGTYATWKNFRLTLEDPLRYATAELELFRIARSNTY